MHKHLKFKNLYLSILIEGLFLVLPFAQASAAAGSPFCPASISYALPSDSVIPENTSLTCSRLSDHGHHGQVYYNLRIYQLRTPQQEERMDSFLKIALLPALHRQGLGPVGVFKPAGNDTASIRHIYVLIPFAGLDKFASLNSLPEKDSQFQADGKNYLDAPYDNPPYSRMESILLQAFPGMPSPEKPKGLTTPASERIYELRSYEGPTDRLFLNKVQMFNKGDEIGLFKKLGFNAIFYASVISGSHMPNLMYMTSFDNMAAREAHWKTFGADPYWKQLSSDPQYQHNVSHIDIVFLHPAPYSDL